MRKKFLLLGFLLAVICISIVLISAKPSIHDFHSFISEEIKNTIQQKIDPELTPVAAELNDYLMASLPLMTSETNLGICSIFSLNMASRKYSFLGIGGRCIPLQSETFQLTK
jgi:hypothetical protein